MSIIRGKDAILYWRYSSEWKPIACMRTWELRTDAELGETSTKGSGRYRTYRGVKNTWSLSAEGLQSFDMNFTVGQLTQAQKRWREIWILATATDGVNTENYSGPVLVTNITRGSAFNAAYNYSLEATGNGDLAITDVPFDPNDITQGGLLMIYPYDGVGDEYKTGALPDLVGMHVPTLARDGVIYRKIDSDQDFDDTKKEFKYDTATGEISFNTSLPPLTAGEAVDIAYQDIP